MTDAIGNSRPAMISALIPNWNGGDRLVTCVSALRRELAAWANSCPDQRSWEIVVVDDASPEAGDLDTLRAEFADDAAADRLILRQRTQNGGFGETVNEAASVARGDLLLLVNNDLEPQRGFISELHRPFAAAERPDAIVATSARTETARGEANHVGMFGRWRGGRLQRDWYDPADADGAASAPADADQVFLNGGASLIRRDAWEAVGGLDDATFSPGYWEDYDLAARLSEAGLGEIVYVPGARAFHLGKESMTAKFGAGRVRDIEAAHRLLFELRHRHAAGISATQLARGVARDLAAEWRRGGPFHETRGLLIAVRKSLRRGGRANS